MGRKGSRSVIPARVERHPRLDTEGDPVLDRDGDPVIDVVEIEPEKTVERKHKPAAEFAARASRDLDPKTFFEDLKARRALPAMPTREEWAAGKTLSSGETIQKLWETVEVQAVHINKLLERIETLELV